jgi:16S rRNA processing protein RimM
MPPQSKLQNVVPQELLDDPELLLIGQIVAAHGIKGAVRIKCNERQLEKFMKVTEIIPALNDTLPPMHVHRSAAVKNTLVLFLDEIDSKEAAEALVHYYVFGKRAEITQPETDEWWARDLIGLDVYTTEGLLVGTICDVICTGNDLLEVRPADANKKDTIFIPFVKEIVPAVRMDLRRVEINAIPGLLDL